MALGGPSAPWPKASHFVALDGAPRSGARHSNRVTTKMSMSHHVVGIPIDFFDPIASDPRFESAHEQWDPMRSEGLVVRDNSSGAEVGD